MGGGDTKGLFRSIWKIGKNLKKGVSCHMAWRNTYVPSSTCHIFEFCLLRQKLITFFKILTDQTILKNVEGLNFFISGYMGRYWPYNTANNGTQSSNCNNF